MRRRIQITMRAAILLVICNGLAVTDLCAQVNSDSITAIYRGKMQKYLDKEKKAAEVFYFTKSGIEVYAPATDTSEKRFLYGFVYEELDVLRKGLSGLDPQAMLKICEGKSDPFTDAERKKILAGVTNIKSKGKPSADKPLQGFRISLDPGHLAGDIETAKMEKKWVDIKSVGAPIIEGELTLATALILKNKLEAQGATVMLTRDQPNISAFGIDFVKWTDSLFIKAADEAFARQDISFEEKNYLLTKATNLEIFRRFFLLEDLRERARRINEFQPDITLIIHYNVDETNSNWNKPTKKNYNMAFVGGSFTTDELDKPEARIEFLRLLLTDDIDRSVEFSKFMVESLVKQTKVPAALDSNAVYLRDNCMNTDAKGVYCRNLTLTRKVKGVICYGESLYQDNNSECKALCKEDASIGTMKTSKRVEEVAEAYYQGILNYVKRKP